MAIYSNAKFSVGGEDISAQVRSLAFNLGAEGQDDTAMGDDTRSAAGGLKTWSFAGEANQSFGTTTQLDVVLATRVGTTQAVIFRPFASATALADTNPKWSGTGLLEEYVPASGNVGDQFVASFTITAAGSLTLTRST